MTIGEDLQQLNSGNSPYLELFEIQVNETDYIYLTNYTEGFGSSPASQFDTIQFRDYDNNSIIRDYYPVPAFMEGIEHKSEGQFPQPRFVVANVLKTLSGDDSLQALLGSLSYEDILGLKVIRRRTLEKYLDSNPPIELPRDIYYLDRVEDENPQTVSFTTVLPIDFTGVLLPKRNIIGTRCPWKYQGAGTDIVPWERSGGCLWKTNSTITIAGNTIYVYVNEDDEYIVDSGTTFTPYVSTADRDSFYSTTESGLTKVGSDGTLTPASSTNYWQSLTGQDIAPSDDSPHWRRVRVWTDFSGTPEVNVYTNDKYNEYFRVSEGGSPTKYVVWKAVYRSQDSGLSTSPEYGSKWERGDACGKRLNSCSVRFQVNPTATLAVSGVSGLSVGDTIIGGTYASTARVTSISGTTLTLASITGDFDSGEALTSDTGLYTGQTASGSIASLPSSNDYYREDVAMPFGGFPTARVFQ